MGWKATVRAMEAAARRQQREEQKRQKELERRAKEQAKLSAIEQARLEVETHENQIEVLLSVHRQQGEAWDWLEVVASLPPVKPRKNGYHELRARQWLELPHAPEDASVMLGRTRLQDEEEYQSALRRYSAEQTDWEKMTRLARRVLNGEGKGYLDALVELNPFEEIANLGSSLHFTVHSPALLECRLKVNGRQAIPSEIKSLTSTGKVSVKPMPKGRFHEVYEDYVCACVLRVVREILALLPVETVLITASADELDPRTGHVVEQPVLSAAIPRADISRLNFERLDPSEAVDNFLHRGDFKASRKSGTFEPVKPLTPADLPTPPERTLSQGELLSRAHQFRAELHVELEALMKHSTTANLDTNQQP
jgi:hypothetical protein